MTEYPDILDRHRNTTAVVFIPYVALEDDQLTVIGYNIYISGGDKIGCGINWSQEISRNGYIITLEDPDWDLINELKERKIIRSV